MSFHSTQATFAALQPMQVVCVNEFADSELPCVASPGDRSCGGPNFLNAISLGLNRLRYLFLDLHRILKFGVYRSINRPRVEDSPIAALPYFVLMIPRSPVKKIKKKETKNKKRSHGNPIW